MQKWGIVILLCLPQLLVAQGQGLQIGLQGGIGGRQAGGDACTWSPEGGLGLRYLARWRVAKQTQLGLYAGAGATCSSFRLEGDYSSQFSRQDYLGNTLEYTTSAHAQEQHRSVGLSVPVLFALHTHGFTLNLGPQVLWTAYDTYRQTVTDANIDVYFPAYKVHVVNQPGTGQLALPYSQSGRSPQNTVHLLLTAEAGYEWQIGNPYSRYNEQYIGLQLYASYGLYSWSEHTEDPFLSVGAISTASPSPQVSIRSIQSASPLAYMSFGVRCYYTIQTVDYPGRGWHHYRRR